MPLGLIALAIGAFGIGLTEFVIMGLLPEVATDFAVTEATAGWLISGYALSVVVGLPQSGPPWVPMLVSSLRRTRRLTTPFHVEGFDARFDSGRSTS